MLTQRDITLIEELLDEKFEVRLKNIPTKDEFFTSMDKIMGELETIRNEQILIAGSQGDYEKRLELLENIHPNGKHQFVHAA